MGRCQRLYQDLPHHQNQIIAPNMEPVYLMVLDHITQRGPVSSASVNVYSKDITQRSVVKRAWCLMTRVMNVTGLSTYLNVNEAKTFKILNMLTTQWQLN